MRTAGESTISRVAVAGSGKRRAETIGEPGETKLVKGVADGASAIVGPEEGLTGLLSGGVARVLDLDGVGVTVAGVGVDTGADVGDVGALAEAGPVRRLVAAVGGLGEEPGGEELGVEERPLLAVEGRSLNLTAGDGRETRDRALDSEASSARAKEVLRAKSLQVPSWGRPAVQMQDPAAKEEVISDVALGEGSRMIFAKGWAASDLNCSRKVVTVVKSWRGCLRRAM